MIECNYSFQDLYKAAFKRAPNKAELIKFSKLSLPKRNKILKEWVNLVGWETQEKLGTDGEIYIAFAPQF